MRVARVPFSHTGENGYTIYGNYYREVTVKFCWSVKDELRKATVKPSTVSVRSVIVRCIRARMCINVSYNAGSYTAAGKRAYSDDHR